MVMICVGLFPTRFTFLIILQHVSVHITAAFVLAAILKCPPLFAEYGRLSSGIGACKSIGLAECILLPAVAVDSNRPRP